MGDAVTQTRVPPPPVVTAADAAARPVRMLPTLLVGTVAMAVVVLIVSWAELVTGKIMIGFLQLPPVVLPLLFLLIVLNRVLRRWAPRAALVPPELAIIFVMMVLASMISSRGVMEDLLPTLAGLNYYADGNGWAAQYFPHIKPWMVPWDPNGPPKQEVTRAFYEGYFYGEPIPWRAWVGPVLVWSVLLGAVFCAFLCLATILRRQWSDQERLAYPLVQLPLEMIREDPTGAAGAILHSSGFWSGFALAFGVFLLNGLHQSYPTLPEVATQIDVRSMFPTKPWSDMSMLTVFVSLAGIGFFYLLPTDLLLSFWFFFLFGRVQEVIASAAGMEPQSFPHAGARHFVGLQTVGSFLALAGYLFWIARGQFRRVMRRALGVGQAGSPPVGQAGSLPHPSGDRHEMMFYRWAFFGLIGSCGVITVWLWLAGMAPWMVLLEMGGYIFIQAIIMARAMAEGGMLMSEGSFTPFDILGAFTSKSVVGASNLTVLAFTHSMFTRDLRGLTLTGFLDGQKLAEGAGLNLRRLLVGIVFALVVAFLMALALQLWLPYRKGAAIQLYGYAYRSNNIAFWREFAPFMAGEIHYQPDAPFWLAVGAAATALLSLLRLRVPWWPLHPLGYAMCCSWTVIVFWFPMFVAWLIKSLVIHYGGMRLFTKLRPFFLGLIFGEFTCATMWTLLAIFFDIPVPAFPWP
jgi:Family of unknown function (DUF6785)/Domain of unknown function (DUF6784)